MFKDNDKNAESNNKNLGLFGNNNTNSLFGNKNTCTDNLFAKSENKKEENILANNNINNNLFGNANENNNKGVGLFGNANENNNKEINYQSRLNSSFFNLVVNSVENINKSEGNLFKNINIFNN